MPRSATARFALEGASNYPDATFTLRLAFGVVKGYEEDGRQVPFQTTFAGLYARATDQNDRPPFDLPPRWLAKKEEAEPGHAASTSSAPPTSSAATPAARSSTARANSSASSSTAISSP